MNIARKLFVSLGILLFAACMGAVLLFDWSITGWKAYSVPTGSMRPTIRPGSLVLVHSVPVKTLKTGDVITYSNIQKPGATITHRIIKSYKIDGKIPAFITKGDANPTPDRPVVGGLVKGKEVFHMPFMGRMLSWGKGIVGLIILVYIPAIFIMIEETQRLSDYYRKFRPYILEGYRPVEKSKTFVSKIATSAKFSVILTAFVLAVSVPVHALLKSNTVALVNNRITVAPRQNQCSSNSTTIITNGSGGSSSNTTTVTNSNTQIGNSGNINVNGNTNVGNINTGNVTNTNCTSTTIIQTSH